MKFLNKKGGVFEDLAGLGTGIAVLAITLVVVFLIMSKAKANSTVAADSNATAALSTLQVAVSDIPAWVPLVVIAFVGAIILGLVKLFRG